MKKQKTAHWEDCSNGWLCSCCGYSYINDYKVCPNCKCKMRNASTSTTPFIRIPEKAKLYVPCGKVAVHKVEKGRVLV